MEVCLKNCCSSYFELDEAFDKGRRKSAVQDIPFEIETSKKEIPDKPFRSDRGKEGSLPTLLDLKNLQCAKMSSEQFSLRTFKS